MPDHYANIDDVHYTIEDPPPPYIGDPLGETVWITVGCPWCHQSFAKEVPADHPSKCIFFQELIKGLKSNLPSQP